MKELTIEIDQDLITQTILMGDILGRALADHKHKWTKNERKIYESTISELKKLDDKLIEKYT